MHTQMNAMRLSGTLTQTIVTDLGRRPGAAPAADAPHPDDLGLDHFFWRVPGAVIVADAATGRIVLWSPAAARRFGYTASEARGLPVDALVPASLRREFRAELARHDPRRQGWSMDACVPFEHPALRRTGEEFDAEFTFTPLRETAGGAYVLVTVGPVYAASAPAEPSALTRLTRRSFDPFIDRQAA